MGVHVAKRGVRRSAPKVLHQPRLYAWTSDNALPIILGPLSETRARAIASVCAGLLMQTSVPTTCSQTLYKFVT